MTVMKDNRGEKEKLNDVGGRTQSDFSSARKKKTHVTELRVTNKVTVCDQKHKSNTLPLEVVLFGSSKASKPAAPCGQTQHSVALIFARQPIN